MMPDEKFFLINGKKKSTGIMEMMIAARDTVCAESLSAISEGSPSLKDEVCIVFNR